MLLKPNIHIIDLQPLRFLALFVFILLTAFCLCSAIFTAIAPSFKILIFLSHKSSQALRCWTWGLSRTPLWCHLIYISSAESNSILIGFAPHSAFRGLYRMSCGYCRQVFLHFHFKAFYYRDTGCLPGKPNKEAEPG